MLTATHRMTKNFLFNFIGNFFSISSNFVISLLIARYLINGGTFYYAIYYFSLGIITYLSIIAGDGFNLSLVTDSRIYSEDEDKSKFFHSYWRTFNIICLISGMLNILIALYYYYITNETQIGITLLILTPTLWSIAIYKYANGIFQINKYLLWDLISKIIALILRITGIILIVFIESLRNPYYLAAIYSGSWVIQSIVTFIPACKIAHLSIAKIFNGIKAKYVNYRKGFSFLIYFILNGNIITLGYVLLEHFSNEDELSYFAAAIQLGNLLLIFTGAISVVLFSEASDLSREQYNEKLQTTTLFAIALLIIAIIPLVTLTNVFYYIYNPIFIPITKQTAILLIAYFINSIIQIIQIPILHFEKIWKLALVYLAAFLFEVAFCVPLAKYGTMGISLVILFTFVIVLILAFYFLNSIIKIKSVLIRTIFGISYGLLLLLIRYLLPDSMSWSAIFFACALVFFIVLLIIIMNKSEKNKIKETLKTFFKREEKALIENKS